MKKRIIKRFLSLPFKRKMLYVEAYSFLLFWHVVGKLMPLGWYKSFFGKRLQDAPEQTLSSPSKTALKISHCVNVSAKAAPWKPVCYPQALTARSMLKLRGMNSTLYFGALYQGGEGLVKLHCWTVHRGAILTGKRGHEDYKVIQIYS